MTSLICEMEENQKLRCFTYICIYKVVHKYNVELKMTICENSVKKSIQT